MWACGEPDPRWHGDLSFSTEEQRAIETGFKFTAEHTGTPPIVVVWDGDLSQSSPRSIQRMRLKGDVLAETDTAGNIDVDADKGFDRLDVIAAHEMGHVLGLKHHDGPGIMNPAASGWLIWTDYDELDARDHVASPK